MLINFNHLKTFYNALVHKMKSFRGNWEQNDPTADDYIKNRPFYSDGAQEKAIFENLASEDYGNNNCPQCNFIPGNLYTVIWNNQRYENIVCILNDGYNTIQVDGVFYIDDDGGNSLYISAETDDYIVSVYSVEETIHKLDKKYLPDTIASSSDVSAQDAVVLHEARAYTDAQIAAIDFPDPTPYVQSDWAQTDDTQNDYIKNKPEIIELASDLSTSGKAADAKLTGDTLNELEQAIETAKVDVANQNIVVLAESQAYINRAIEAAKIDAATQDAVVLHEAQAYTDAQIATIDFPEPTPYVQSDWNQVDDTQPDYIKNKPVLNSNFMILVDQVNGYDYVVQMMNGDLVSFCRCSSIDVTVPPNKRGYMEGEEIDTTGMVVSAVCQDGSTRQIENYTYSPKVMTPEVEQLDIQYVECGEVYTASTTIGLKGIADVLIDFEYIPNGDGTYTLTSWSGTLNGQPSTELIVPDNDKLIV